LNQVLENQFVETIKLHQGIVHKVCGMYRHDPDDRKDLFQEIVIQLWRAFPKFRQESKISTWIYQIALNVAISDFRKESRRPQKVEISEVLMNISENDYDPETEERIQQMHLAIAQLSETEKAIVMLYFEEKSNEEIAEIVGITQNNVRVKMTRIREKLKSHVARQSLP
jgi:RNA polymerase sigma-70 factor, ECF subfamily